MGETHARLGLSSADCPGSYPVKSQTRARLGFGFLWVGIRTRAGQSFARVVLEFKHEPEQLSVQIGAVIYSCVHFHQVVAPCGAPTGLTLSGPVTNSPLTFSRRAES